MNEKAKEARRAYQAAYRAVHREDINAYKRDWAKKNRDRVRGYNAAYWKKRAEKSE